MTARKKAAKTPARRERFYDLSLPQQVRRATPLARAMLLEVGPDTRESSNVDTTNKVEELTGFNVFSGTEDTEVRALIDALHAAYVFGIAVGLMVRPEMFTDTPKGGAR